MWVHNGHYENTPDRYDQRSNNYTGKELFDQ